MSYTLHGRPVVDVELGQDDGMAYAVQAYYDDTAPDVSEKLEDYDLEELTNKYQGDFDMELAEWGACARYDRAKDLRKYGSN